MAAMLLAAPALDLRAVPASAEEAYVVETDGHTLRAAPKATAPGAGRVKVGEKVFVTSRTTGWVQVETGDRRGWLAEALVSAEPSATQRVGPLQEQVGALETRAKGLEAEKAALEEQNARLSAQAAELGQGLDRAKQDAAGARASRRIGEMALGGGLVILGWLAGYALHRRGGTRYRIG